MRSFCGYSEYLQAIWNFFALEARSDWIQSKTVTLMMISSNEDNKTVWVLANSHQSWLSTFLYLVLLHFTNHQLGTCINVKRFFAQTSKRKFCPRRFLSISVVSCIKVELLLKSPYYYNINLFCRPNHFQRSWMKAEKIRVPNVREPVCVCAVVLSKHSAENNVHSLQSEPKQGYDCILYLGLYHIVYVSKSRHMLLERIIRATDVNGSVGRCFCLILFSIQLSS